MTYTNEELERMKRSLGLAPKRAVAKKSSEYRKHYIRMNVHARWSTYQDTFDNYFEVDMIYKDKNKILEEHTFESLYEFMLNSYDGEKSISLANVNKWGEIKMFFIDGERVENSECVEPYITTGPIPRDKESGGEFSVLEFETKLKNRMRYL